MNQQPLEGYSDEAIYGCGFKILNRTYAGPLLRAVRHSDGLEVDVYADFNGYVSSTSSVDVINGTSSYASFNDFVSEIPNEDIGVSILYDQSEGVNNLINSDIATQPLMVINGVAVFSDWGWSASLANGKFFESNSIQENVTIHYRLQLNNISGTKYLFKQNGSSVYAKVTNSYLDETIGVDTAVVFVNENYYRDYTTYNINIPDNEGSIVTLEVTPDPLLLNSPPVYRIENIDTLHSVIMYEDISAHVRRHSTNLILSEDLPALHDKLKKFNPQSYYNIVSGASALFGLVSFAGILGPDNTKILRARREWGLHYSLIDVYSDNTGYINLNSPVSNPSDGSTASTLGEWVAHSNYTDVDGVGPVDAHIEQLYSQINDSNFAYSGGFNRPKLYDAFTESMISANYNGAIGLEFYNAGDNVPEKSLTLNTPIWAKTVVVVYANQNNFNELNTLVSAGFGPEIFSKFYYQPLGSHGVTVNDETTINFTELGVDTDVHVVSLYEDSQKLIVDTYEHDITYDPIPNGIEGTSLENDAKWKFIGANSQGGSTPHKGYIAAVIFYEDDKYVQSDFIHSYFNTLFGIQNIPISNEASQTADSSYELLSNNTGSTAAYSLRKINPSYTGSCLRVRRESDGNEIDIPFNSLGSVNESALGIFCANTNGYVTMWYDQSGSGNHLVQAIDAYQPQIVSSGTVLKQNNKPTVSFDGVSQHMTSLSAVSLTSENAILVVSKGLSTSSDAVASIDGSSGVELKIDSGVYNLSYTDLDQHSITSSTDSQFLFFGGRQSSNNLVHASINGGAQIEDTTTASSSWNTTSDVIQIGSKDGVGSFWQGDIQEFVYWPLNKFGARNEIESEVNFYYSVYLTGLFSEYPEAAYYYSVRKLNSNYSGYAIRVRRSSDNTEMDIGFSGENLNVSQLASFCTGTDGLVSIWYDQSSNANHLVQAVSSNQMQIVDNGSVIVDANNNPRAIISSISPHYSSLSTMSFGPKMHVFSTVETLSHIYATTHRLVTFNSSNNEYILWSQQSSTFNYPNVYSANERLNKAAFAPATLGEAWSDLNSGLNVFSSSFNYTLPPHYYNKTLQWGWPSPGSGIGPYPLQELIIYNTDQVSNVEGIETNMMNYYGVTPPTISGIPVIESYQVTTVSPPGVGVATTYADAPLGIQPGDFLLIMCTIDNTGSTLVYDTPTGWTKMFQFGSSIPDTHLAAFYRVADGTEPASQAINISAGHSGINDHINWYLRMTSVNTADPIDTIGGYASGSSQTTINANFIQTQYENSLVFALSSFSGGDGSPVVPSGTGWPTSFLQDQSLSYPSQDIYGVTSSWMTKAMPLTGNTQYATFSYPINDGCGALQFAIRGL